MSQCTPMRLRRRPLPMPHGQQTDGNELRGTPKTAMRPPRVDLDQSEPPTSNTIRHLRVAFQDTPPHLKDLESGWRLARRYPGENAIRTALKKPAAATKEPKLPIGMQKVNGGTQDVTTPAKRKVCYSFGSAPANTTEDEGVDHGPSLLPTPPPSPRLRPRKPMAPRRDNPTLATEQLPPGSTRPCRSASRPHEARPIICHPLPPLPPTRISSKCSVSVLEASEPSSMIVTLGRRDIRLSRTGTSLTVKDRKIRLDENQNWSQQDVRLWQTVARLVDDLKRHTARVR